MVTTFAYVAIAMGGLAGVFALWLLVRYVPQLRAQRWSALALWGMLSVFAAGALLVAGGSYRVRGYFRDQARQEETAIRHSLFVEDPVQSLLLRFEGANPFHERPEDCLLRLHVEVAPNRAFVSELTPSQLHPPSGNPEEAARKIDWATILDGISDAKGKQEAQKLAHIGDWRLVQKMHIEIVDRRTWGEKVPGYMSLRFNRHEPKLFSAPSAAPVQRADGWVVVFRDASSPGQRLDAPFRAAVRPLEPTLGKSLTLSFAGGLLLLAAGGMLLLVARRKASEGPAIAVRARTGCNSQCCGAVVAEKGTKMESAESLTAHAQPSSRKDSMDTAALAPKLSPAGWSKSPEPGASAFVWGIWVLMLFGLAHFIEKYSVNLPWYDEWITLVPVFADNSRFSFEWLWEQHAEHRYPFTKLLLFGLAKLTHYDFRAGIFFSAVGLATFALALMVAARRIRGWTSYADAFFPVALLNWGQHQTFYWGTMAAMTLITLVAGAVLVIVACGKRELTPLAALAAGICLLLLPLCGGQALPYVPPLALWFTYEGILQWCSSEPRKKWLALVVWAFVALSVIELALYFVGWDKAAAAPYAGTRATLETTAQFLSMSLGAANHNFWTYTGVGISIFLLLTAAVAIWILLRQPAKRHRIVGLVFFSGGVVSLALAIGVGRGGEGLGGLAFRFIPLAIPALCSAFLIWGLQGGAAGRLVQMGLLVIMCLVLVDNSRIGIEHASARYQQLEPFERDVDTGLPRFILAEQHYTAFFPDDVTTSCIPLFTEGMEGLQRAGIAPFSRISPDPPFQEVSFPVDSARANGMKWDRGVGHGHSEQSSLVFALDKAQHVYAVRFRCRYEHPRGTRVSLQMFWRDSKRMASFEAAASRDLRRITGLGCSDVALGEMIATVWVDDWIDEIRIHPDDKPFVFHLTDVVWLVPPRGEGAPPLRPRPER